MCGGLLGPPQPQWKAGGEHVRGFGSQGSRVLSHFKQQLLHARVYILCFCISFHLNKGLNSLKAEKTSVSVFIACDCGTS